MQFNRKPNETDEELLYRICEMKENIGTWQQVCDILNEILGLNHAESTYRKKYTSYRNSLITHDNTVNNNSLSEFDEQRRQLEREKVKYRDERNEYQKLIRQEARKESYIDLVKDLLSEVKPKEIGTFDNDIIDGDNDLIIHCTDIHTGLEINNFFNKFDEHVLQFRFAKYLDDIFQIQERHQSENAYVIISEILSGLIHENLRIENNQNLIEQFLTISEYLTDFLDQLSQHFKHIHVYVCPGNHSRATAKKESSLKGENFDHLILPYLSARLQNFKNVHFYQNSVEESVCMFSVRGNVVMGVHGDKDRPENVVQKFSLLFSMVPDLIYMGHRHHNALSTVYDTKIIESGSWCGADSYALDLRLKTRPEQTVSVVNKDGLVCLYDIQLDA